MNKIFMVILWIVFVLWFGSTFWYFEDKVYCNIENNDVTISLRNYSWTSKCKVYVDIIQQNALKMYDEIMLINSYIVQWEDVYYWKKLLEEKKSEFIELVNYRTQIVSVVNRFEKILFDKYYHWLQKEMKDYYLDLESQYYSLVNDVSQKRWSGNGLKKTQLKQQMENVSSILDAKNLDDIIKVSSSYIYLKKQIEWK